MTSAVHAVVTSGPHRELDPGSSGKLPTPGPHRELDPGSSGKLPTPLGAIVLYYITLRCNEMYSDYLVIKVTHVHSCVARAGLPGDILCKFLMERPYYHTDVEILKKLKDLALDAETELERQDEALDDLTAAVDRTTLTIDKHNRRMKKLT
ncbi:hypothetical protein CB1_000422010 [Camelus ferus]|nr:hypothetical protein CB1_000422010 [Camelus ferus]